MNDPLPTPTRPLTFVAAMARWLLRFVLAAWLVFALAWGVLHGWIVPRIDEFRPRLESEATRALGVPVRIREIAARTEGLFPTFELDDVSLLDPQGREALRLPRVVVAVSPRSLFNLGFEQMYIEQPELDVRRGADGRLRVAGLDFSQPGGDDGQAADWFFSQTEFVIRRGTVRWTDDLRGSAPLALADVDLVVRNGARTHALRLDATPPADWGTRFSLRGVFRQPLLSTREGRWQDWSGQLFADFPQVDVSQLRRHADLGVDLREGRGALRLWADVVQGAVSGGAADLLLDEVSVTLASGLQPLAFDALSGRLSGRRLASGFEFATRDLQFRTDDGLVWPGGNVRVAWTGAEGRMAAQGELRADRLDLESLSRIASRLPLGTVTHAALTAYAPRGLVESVQARWQGPLGAPERYEARGRVLQLALAARGSGNTPGLSGASVDFDLTQAGGTARLAVVNGAVELPGVFEDPLVRIDQMTADLNWQVQGTQIQVNVGNARFANADAEGQLQASWRTSDPARSPSRARFPGVLDLQGTLSRANGAQVYRYLPLVVPKYARYYVRDAVLNGDAGNVKFRVRGDLWNMPFKDPKSGEFLISADVRNVGFAYVPRGLQPADGLPWPSLTQLDGQLVFERAGMQVRGARARVLGTGGLQVIRADARIADLGSKDPVVEVEGELRGPLADALAVVRGSPLSEFTGRALNQASATGNADLRLRLALPLADLPRSKVQGAVVLAGNDVQITPDSPLLARARGTVNFSETGFSLAGAQARMLGGDLRLEGGSRSGANEPAVLLRAQGAFTAEGLRQARELGFVSRLGTSMQGGAAYSATLAFRRGVPELSFQSTLQGLALNLPAPLSKTAEQPLPLRYESALLREPDRLHDQLTLELGRLASISYVRDQSAAVPRVLRGSISVGVPPAEAAPMPPQGVAANIQLAAVDVDAWERALSGASGGSVVATDGQAAANPALGYLPTQMAVRASQLLLDGRRLNEVVVGGSRDGLTWRANLDARELNGYVEYRQPSGQNAGRLYARLARLSIAAAEAQQVETLLDEQPATIPALDVLVEDFELRGKRLGRVEIDAVNRGGAATREGGVREWRLNRLALTTPEASFSATGNWAAIGAAAAPGAAARTGETRRTVMNFRLDIGDSGLLLARFGMPDVIRQGKGRMEGQVAWVGSPLTLDYPTLNGSFNVNVESGQFLKADPGIAKLLGVLSLQSLPRRLTLDFRDVFTEGFAFDFVRGDVTIQQGIAATNNLQMKGVNAAVLMEGRADIARETQDLRAVVVPEINAGTASLVATAINPALGLGSFLAQMFLRRPLMEAATQEFRIDGTWADPRVTRIPRVPPAEKAEAPRSAAPPAAAPSVTPSATPSATQ